MFKNRQKWHNKEISMRKELIDKIFNEFDKDKEIIKRNLTEVMDEIYITTENKYEKIILEIKVERK